MDVDTNCIWRLYKEDRFRQVFFVLLFLSRPTDYTTFLPLLFFILDKLFNNRLNVLVIRKNLKNKNYILNYFFKICFIKLIFLWIVRYLQIAVTTNQSKETILISDRSQECTAICCNAFKIRGQAFANSKITGRFPNP